MNPDYMTTKQLKQACIEKCKDKAIPSSWIQTCTNDVRKDFLNGKYNPTSSTPPKTKPETTSTEEASTPTRSVQPGSIEELVVKALKPKISETVLDLSIGLTEKMELMVHKAENAMKPLTIHVKDKPVIDLTEELTHPAFTDVFEALHYKNNVCLVGPAGTGKSTLVKQVWDKLADINNMDARDTFQYIGCSAGLSEAQLLGKMDAHGKYHMGLAVDRFENGGLNLWDEADAMDGNAGLIRNAMLDGQGYIAVPNRTGEPIAWKNDNYFDASCMNTFGDGQDFTYSGRGQQDSATLDRLGDTTIFIDYDPSLEKALIGKQDQKWADMLWELRKRMNDEHLDERILSTRRFADAQVWAEAGKPRDWFLDRITVAWTKEELDKVNINEIKRNYR